MATLRRNNIGATEIQFRRRPPGSPATFAFYVRVNFGSSLTLPWHSACMHTYIHTYIQTDRQVTHTSVSS
jgi:hypothetical protein